MKYFKNIPSWCPDYSTSVPPLREFSSIERTWRLGLSWSDAQVPKVYEASSASLLRAKGLIVNDVVEIVTLIEDRENSGTKYGVGAAFNLAT